MESMQQMVADLFGGGAGVLDGTKKPTIFGGGNKLEGGGLTEVMAEIVGGDVSSTSEVSEEEHARTA